MKKDVGLVSSPDHLDNFLPFGDNENFLRRSSKIWATTLEGLWTARKGRRQEPPRGERLGLERTGDNIRRDRLDYTVCSIVAAAASSRRRGWKKRHINLPLGSIGEERRPDFDEGPVFPHRGGSEYRGTAPQDAGLK